MFGTLYTIKIQNGSYNFSNESKRSPRALADPSIKLILENIGFGSFFTYQKW